MAYAIHIPTSCDLDLCEALETGSRLALRAYLRLIAELAESTPVTDEVWNRLDRTDDGRLRWFSNRCEVIFDVDHVAQAVVVLKVRVSGVRRAS